MKLDFDIDISVVDVEGNGHSPPDLVEVAIQPFKFANIDHETSSTWLIKPPNPIIPRVFKIHGISNEMVESCPEWKQLEAEIEAKLGTSWIVAHNATTDYSVLKRHLPTWSPPGVIDTIKLAKAAIPNLPSYSLEALVRHSDLNIQSFEGKLHRASYDAYVTARLFEFLLIELQPSSWLEVCNIGAIPLKSTSNEKPSSEQGLLW